MDKNAIKKYAVWARNELIARVTQKAEQYEITEKKTTPKDADSIGGRLLTEAEKNQRKALIETIEADGFEQVMEEVAYTWFNRFTALRFMEVNNYLPSHTRVFTNESGEFKPQILADAIQLDLEGLNLDKVYELKDANKTEELYKYLLITQCNALSGILPRMFQKIEHYTELLLPDYLLREGSVIEQMITMIPEEDWTDQVQIIGWLYQYYNIEPKAAVFARPNTKKIEKQDIPAATQLFTPDWIVRYMVENSLGRMWVEGHPNDALQSEWKYYLDEAEQEIDVQKQLDEIHKKYAELKPEEIRCIDPCMGSGHILSYMFDVLVKIYGDYGYTAREAVESIVEKNLWGLDIDERAAQLSYFAVMMKARQYDRRFFNKKDDNGELCIPQPHVYAIEESNGITSAPMHDMGIGLSQEEYGKAVKEAMRLVEEMNDAKEYGSIIHVTPCDWDLLRRFAVPRGSNEGQMMLDIHGEIEASSRLQELINIGEALSQSYEIVITNPPYMGNKSMSSKLSTFIKKNYPDSKTDFYSVFIERCYQFMSNVSLVGMITQHSWMFLSRFDNLRSMMIEKNIVNMAHLGSRAFEEIGGEIVQTTTWVQRNINVNNYKGRYVRLVDYDTQEEKEKAFLDHKDTFFASGEQFRKIPSCTVAYWIGDTAIQTFDNPKLAEYADPLVGMFTTDNDTYLRFWWEPEINNIGFGFSSKEEAYKSAYKYFPYNKGGGYRKWYGNIEYVVRYENGGEELKKLVVKKYPYLKGNYDFVLKTQNPFFEEGITWSDVGTGDFSCRYTDPGFMFDVKGSSMFPDKDTLLFFIGFLNSKFVSYLMYALNPTMSFQIGNIKSLPIIIDGAKDSELKSSVLKCITISREDWDSRETSWNFKKHPFLCNEKNIREAFVKWEQQCNARYEELKENEEKINRFFAHLYKMDEVIDSSVDENSITLRGANKEYDVRSFISYSVGCMFGRYTPNKDGIIFAGGETWDVSKYTAFIPDKDGIIPICDDEYFDDDIVVRFVEFLKTIYGDESLEDNLQFVADALGGKGTSREIIRNYFMNDFYSDHVKLYQKKPIYWMFDSGKKNGFKCLVYMHRYQPDTIARIRTDYVHEQQSRYRTAITDLENRIGGAMTSERVKLNKQLAKLQSQADEIREYEEKIHHLADQMISIDLDDGVKHNYEIFKDVLAKIK